MQMPFESIPLALVTVALSLLQTSKAQFDSCLRPGGCHGDYCCYSAATKTGPICDPLPGCAAAFKPDCCRNARPVHTDYGVFYGYAILLDDVYGYHSNGRRYLEIWKGVPYARPPTRENNLRFRKPVPPSQSQAKYDATFFRPSCPQPSTALKDNASFAWTKSPHDWARRLPVSQTTEQLLVTSEDCLYLNIYTLNETSSSTGTLYPGVRPRRPIIVFLDGLDHLTGTGNRYPGHVLAQLGFTVIFVNYRLGPLGFLATTTVGQAADSDFSDDIAVGNYGLWDQVRALQFIRENAAKFFGDPNQVTLIGHGSAAADVALHLLSLHSGRSRPPLFHRAILMSGSDLSEGGFVRHPDETKLYAKELAYRVGCDTSSARHMLACLRARPAEELADIGGQVRLHRQQWLTRPWAPTVDGDFLEDWPVNLWRTRQFAHIPLIGGVTVDYGVFHGLSHLLSQPNASIVSRVEEMIFDQPAFALEKTLRPKRGFLGLTEDIVEEAFETMAHHDYSLDPPTVRKALVFQYTDWSNCSDDRRRWNKFREAWTDRLAGSGLVQTLRYHSSSYQPGYGPNRTQMYVFAYKSNMSEWTDLLGVYRGSELPYIFGLPLMTLTRTPSELAEDWPRDLQLEPLPWNYSQLDINMSYYMISMFVNFARSGNATPSAVRNLTWDTYRPDNRTYFWFNLTGDHNLSRSNRIDLEQMGLGAGFDLRQNYRVYDHAYWSYLYPRQLLWQPVFPQIDVRPSNIDRIWMAWISLTGAFVIVLIFDLILGLLYCRKRRQLT